MKIVIAPDSYKGCAASAEICDLIERGVKKVFPDAEIVKIPLADGGEGSVDALYAAKQGVKVRTAATSPDGFKIYPNILLYGESTAIVEMAMASGLNMVNTNKLNPLVATSYGTGEMIVSAMEKLRSSNGDATFISHSEKDLFGKVEKKKIIVTLGGSATNDCGIGMAAALGYKFYDIYGDELLPFAENMINVDEIDSSEVNEHIFNFDIIGLCDVANKLYGDKGATSVYGKQKGVNESNFEILEEGMKNMARLFKSTFSVDVSDVEMAGAAGGMGAALMAFCNAKLCKGIDRILDFVDFDNQIKDASLVITGEGCFDAQSKYGKVVDGVLNRTNNLSIPTLVMVGQYLEDSDNQSVNNNVTVVATMEDGMTREESILNYATLIPQRIEEALSDMKL